MVNVKFEGTIRTMSFTQYWYMANPRRLTVKRFTNFDLKLRKENKKTEYFARLDNMIKEEDIF